MPNPRYKPRRPPVLHCTNTPSLAVRARWSTTRTLRLHAHQILCTLHVALVQRAGVAACDLQPHFDQLRWRSNEGLQQSSRRPCIESRPGVSSCTTWSHMPTRAPLTCHHMLQHRVQPKPLVVAPQLAHDCTLCAKHDGIDGGVAHDWGHLKFAQHRSVMATVTAFPAPRATHHALVERPKPFQLHNRTRAVDWALVGGGCRLYLSLEPNLRNNCVAPKRRSVTTCECFTQAHTHTIAANSHRTP